MTLAPSPRLKWAVFSSAPAAETDWPSPMASDDEKASTSSMPGLCLSRPCLTPSDHMTPLEEMSTSDDRSQWPGRASSARSIGLPKASPTMVNAPTRSRSIVSNISSTSKWRDSRVTTEPPWDR